MTRPLVIGNWKMNGDGDWLGRVEAIDRVAGRVPQVEVGLCVPATLLHRAASVATALSIGAQDCHPCSAGSYTGSLSAAMVREAGARLVILGHSERRSASGCGDDNEVIASKVESAEQNGLQPVLCVGETAEQRASGETISAVRKQLAGSLPSTAAQRLIIAYEPVWAIGRGFPPETSEIETVIAVLRSLMNEAGLSDARLLYGGSVTASSACSLIASLDIDGFLVGNASLDPHEMGEIVAAVERTSVRAAGGSAR